MTISKNKQMENKKIIADILNDNHHSLSDEERREAEAIDQNQNALKALQYQDRAKEIMAHDSMGYTKLPKK